MREIDLLNEVRRRLYAYLHSLPLDARNPYLFRSQRSPRLTEAGIHHWFRQLKTQATSEEWSLIVAVNFHDLRHDFAHRARRAGGGLGEIAYYIRYSIPSTSPSARHPAGNSPGIKK